MQSVYQNLFSEGSIGSCRIKNRMVFAPAETLYASACGEVTPQLIAFYQRRAQGGVGLITLHSVQGNTAVDPVDPYAGSLRLDNDAYIPGMSDLTEAVHFEGAKITALVSIGGGMKAAGEPYLTNQAKDCRRVAPSEIPGRPDVRALTLEEIYALIDAYGRCAGRARQAGFDAFSIHAMGGYLLAEFLSPYYNKRNDAFGGSAQNRWNLLFSLIASCQKYAGKDFPLILRMAVDEMSAEGRNIDETLRFLPLLEEAGICAWDITAGTFDPMCRTIPSIYVPRGVNVAFVQKIKAASSVRVICSGKMQDAAYAESLLSQGVCDFVSIARGLIADPDLPIKTLQEQEQQVRKCISCNYCIGHRIMKKLPIRCAINPCAGREWLLPKMDGNALKGRCAAVIGAGPAGLEAATVLADRGCEVDIYEAADRLCGGQLHIASIPPFKDLLNNIPAYYASCLQQRPNIHVHLCTPVDEDSIDALQADLFVVATGGKPIVPSGIPGVHEANVHTAQDALLGRCNVGERVLIVGGGQIGAETALHLASMGKTVTIIELLDEIAKQEELFTRSGLLQLLENARVTLLPRHKIISLENHVAKLLNMQSGEQKTMQFDTALLALGTRSDNSLYAKLRAAGKSAVVVGDSAHSGNIAAAIASAHMAAIAVRLDR